MQVSLRNTILSVVFFAAPNAVYAYELPYYIYGKSVLNANFKATINGSYVYSLDGQYATRSIKDVNIGLFTKEILNPRAKSTLYSVITKGSTYDSSHINLFTSNYPGQNVSITYSSANDPLQNKVASIANGNIHAQLSGITGGFSDFQSLTIFPGTKQDFFGALISNSVKSSIVYYHPGIPSMSATFTPNFGVTIDDAAKIGGYTGFNWIQKVIHLPSPSPYIANNNPDVPLTTANGPFNDPIEGGYTYQNNNNPYPYYLNASELIDQKKEYTLSTNDTPADQCLYGGTGKGCGGMTAEKGEYLGFTTDLVGVRSDGSPGPILSEFMWYSTFNGTSGNTSRLDANVFGDPGSGYGTAGIISRSYPLDGGQTSTGPISPVPLPSSIALEGSALLLLGLTMIVLRRRRSSGRQRLLRRRSR